MNPKLRPNSLGAGSLIATIPESVDQGVSRRADLGESVEIAHVGGSIREFCRRSHTSMLMSAIVITPDGLTTVAKTLECLKAQTVSQQIEVVLIGPGISAEVAESDLEDAFGAVCAIEIADMRSTSAARAAGILEAQAPIVALTEDHSYPEPDWAEALVEAHNAGRTVVGPAVVNANPDSVTSWANFIIEYCDWIDPAPAGEYDHLPGHNSSYNKEVLRALGADLVSSLEAESLLHWRLKESGHQLWLEPGARTRHLNFSQFLPSIRLRYDCGHLFAGVRAQHWPAVKRLAYAVASPLIPWVRLARIGRRMSRPGRLSGRILLATPAVVFLLIVDAIGELAGYLSGPGDAPERIAEIDFHRERYINARDRRRIPF